MRFFFCVGKGYLRDSLLIRICYRDFLLLFSFGDGDILIFAGFRNLCFTFLYLIGNFDSTQLFLFFDVGLCFVQSLAFSFLTQVDDVVGSVADITDIDVHQIQTELAKFRVDVVFYFRQEFITVGVQLFDSHVCNHQTHLTVYYIRNQVLFVIHCQSQHTFGSILHHFRVCADSYGDGSGYVHTDILGR